MEEVSREALERIAHILGPNSAAAMSLEKAKECADPLFFRNGRSIYVIDKKALIIWAWK